MFDIIELNGKKVDELKTIAKELEVPKFNKLKKEQLIYKILDYQAERPVKASEVIASKTEETESKPRQNKARTSDNKRAESGSPKTPETVSYTHL